MPSIAAFQNTFEIHHLLRHFLAVTILLAQVAAPADARDAKTENAPAIKHDVPYTYQLLKKRDSWLWDAPGSVIVWKLLMEQAEAADKAKDYTKELTLLEGALEHSRAFLNNDHRKTETVAKIQACAVRLGHTVSEKNIHDLILPKSMATPELLAKPKKKVVPKAETIQQLEPVIQEADLWVVEGRTAEATKAYQKALRILHARPIRDEELIVKIVDRLTRLYYRQDRFTDIETMVRKELTQHESQFEQMDDTDPQKRQLAFLLGDLGLAYVGQDRLPEAEALYTAILKILRKQLTEDHHDYIVTLSELARVHKLMGEYVQSDKEYRQAMQLIKNNDVMSKAARGVIFGNYAKLLRRMGKTKAADEMDSKASALLGTKSDSASLDVKAEPVR